MNKTCYCKKSNYLILLNPNDTLKEQEEMIEENRNVPWSRVKAIKLNDGETIENTGFCSITFKGIYE